VGKPLLRQGVCVYCGNTGQVTLDHVIPQCLFSGRIPKDAPVVDACLKCNGEMKSAFDTYLRDLLVNDMSSSRNSEAQKLLPKYERARARNRSILDRDMRTDYEVIGLTKPSGIISSFADTSWIVDERVKIIMRMTIGGLFHYYLHELLPLNTPFEVSRVIDIKLIEKTVRELGERGGRHACIGTGDVFECTFGNSQEKPDLSVWVLNFYRSVVFLAFTGITESKIIVAR
jgi:hypothetical protein